MIIPYLHPKTIPPLLDVPRDYLTDKSSPDHHSLHSAASAPAAEVDTPDTPDTAAAAQVPCRDYSARPAAALSAAVAAAAPNYHRSAADCCTLRWAIRRSACVDGRGGRRGRCVVAAQRRVEGRRHRSRLEAEVVVAAGRRHTRLVAVVAGLAFVGLTDTSGGCPLGSHTHPCPVLEGCQSSVYECCSV